MGVLTLELAKTHNSSRIRNMLQRIKLSFVHFLDLILSIYKLNYDYAADAVLGTNLSLLSEQNSELSPSALTPLKPMPACTCSDVTTRDSFVMLSDNSLTILVLEQKLPV